MFHTLSIGHRTRLRGIPLDCPRTNQLHVHLDLFASKEQRDPTLYGRMFSHYYIPHHGDRPTVPEKSNQVNALRFGLCFIKSNVLWQLLQ